MIDLSPPVLSLLVASTATVLLVPPGILAAWFLARRTNFPGRALVETLLSLPLVLPPTVVGYALLLLLGNGTSFGRWLNDTVGLHLLFTWQSATIAASVMAFPLFVRTASAAFATVENDLLEAGRTLGARESTLLFRVLIPLSYRGLLAAFTLAFARALGEFGATLIVAGTIPGRTETLPLALYSATQTGRTSEALRTAALLTVASFILLALANVWAGHIARTRGDR